jgi:parallel beta-helix repeat protein
MQRKVLVLTLILCLAASMLASIEFIRLTQANAIMPPERLPTGQAYIRGNGDVEPPTLPIQRIGDDKYVLTATIVNWTIEIQRSNLELDGDGYSISIPLYGEKDASGQTKSVPPLINMRNCTNISIKNFILENGPTPIAAWSCSYISILNNTITNCKSTYFHSCTKCIIMQNIMTNNDLGLYGYEVSHFEIKYNQIRDSDWHAIILEGLCNSSIIGNVFAGNAGCGICYLGSYNRVIGNEFNNNEQGILSYVGNNEIHHNNFDNLYEDLAVKPPTILDDGKEGNYWSSNSKSEPFMIPSVFIADKANIDNFPRTSPYIFDYQPPIVGIVSPENATNTNGNLTVFFSASEEVSRATYSLDGNESAALSNGTLITGLSDGVHNLTVYAEDVFGNEGTSEIITFEVGTASSETFPLVLIAAISVPVAFAIIGPLVYFKKRGKKAGVKRE